MSSQKKLIWLLSKDQDYINFTVYGVPDGLSTFYLTYIWYIICLPCDGNFNHTAAEEPPVPDPTPSTRPDAQGQNIQIR